MLEISTRSADHRHADTLWNYELGVKSRHANGRLTLNAAVYRYKWSGVQLIAGLPAAASPSS